MFKIGSVLTNKQQYI